MLNQKEIKLPKIIKIYFLIIQNQRFIVFNNTLSNTNMSINIPASITIKKIKNILVLNENIFTTLKKIDGFYTYLKNFIVGFQVPAKKTLILRGLGLKANLQNSILSLKLGYSHENIIRIDSRDQNKFFLGKKFISVLNYNKIFLGNFVEKLYRLKKANCYKGRGLYYKEKKIIIKTVKKT